MRVHVTVVGALSFGESRFNGLAATEAKPWGKLGTMTVPLAALALLVLAGLLFWALGRHLELAKLRARNGTLQFVRGRLPPELLGDIRDIVDSAHVAQAEVRLMVEDGRPRVVAKGLDDTTAQQLRNVVGAYRVSQIRAGRSPRR